MASARQPSGPVRACVPVSGQQHAMILWFGALDFSSGGVRSLLPIQAPGTVFQPGTGTRH